MGGRMNAGYAITDSVHIADKELVIGENPKSPSPFVTWMCVNGDNYFWGHYLPDRRSAERDLLERAQLELMRSAPQERLNPKAMEQER